MKIDNQEEREREVVLYKVQNTRDLTQNTKHCTFQATHFTRIHHACDNFVNLEIKL